MNELPVVDDRTIEQIRADGDDRTPDGFPYIKNGVCCVCMASVDVDKANLHSCLVKLETPGECEMHLLVQEPQRCTGLARWAFGVIDLTAMCDECIVGMLERLPDNRDWLAPALADLRERHLKIGDRVRIQAAGVMQGQLGTVYRHLPSRPAPWHVRPDIWAEDAPGIAYMADELDVML